MPKTLLLADDSVTIQKVVGISFANEDVKLVTVDNGDDAVARARQMKPDVVLADVVMPGMSGYEVCEAIKSDPELRHVPVLLLTGTFEAFDEARARQAGADGHITKPFEAQALVSRVNGLLSRPPARPAEPTAAARPAAAPRAPAGAPPPPPTPAPAASGSAETYDFFDDDLDRELGAPEETPAAEEPTEATPGGGFELGGSPDLGDLSLGSDDSLDLDSTPDLEVSARDLAPRSPERTVAFMPDEPAHAAPGGPRVGGSPGPRPAPPPVARDEDPAATQLADFDDFATPPATPPSRPAPAADPAETVLADDLFGPADDGDALTNALPSASEDLDFAFDDAPTRPPVTGSSEPADALETRAQETVLDEGAAAAYDVSSSDLGDSLVTPRAASPSGRPDRAPSRPEAWEDEPEPEPRFGQPAAASRPAPPAGPPPPPVAMAEAELEPSFEPSFDPEPRLAPTPEPEPPVARPAPAREPQAPRPELPPVMRQQLHETLERVAWDAFADLSETIVKQVLGRVEKIAWEVIPQMAETLILEEIRRMKGEDGD